MKIRTEIEILPADESNKSPIGFNIYNKKNKIPEHDHSECEKMNAEINNPESGSYCESRDIRFFYKAGTKKTNWCYYRWKIN